MNKIVDCDYILYIYLFSLQLLASSVHLHHFLYGFKFSSHSLNLSPAFLLHPLSLFLEIIKSIILFSSGDLPSRILCLCALNWTLCVVRLTSFFLELYFDFLLFGSRFPHLIASLLVSCLCVCSISFSSILRKRVHEYMYSTFFWILVYIWWSFKKYPLSPPAHLIAWLV